jgi:hypothetical protein
VKKRCAKDSVFIREKKLVESQPSDPYNLLSGQKRPSAATSAKGWSMEVINTGKKGKKSKDQEDSGEMFDIVAFIEKCTTEENLDP